MIANRSVHAALMFWSVALALLFFVQASTAQEVAALQQIAAQYELEVIAQRPVFPIKTAYGEIGGKAAGKTAVERYAKMFSAEFGLYPTALIRQVGLKRVVLCGGLAYANQRRNAVPDFRHDTLYLDVERGSYNQTYMRRVIHHEFFHMVDYKDDGKLYKDQRWSALNPAPFEYGRGGRLVQDQPMTSVFTDKYAGFLNHYSTMGVEEDKAELFSSMIVNPRHVEQRAKDDEVVKRKVGLMKRTVQDYCPEMNDKFWEDARRHATKRNDQ